MASPNSDSSDASKIAPSRIKLHKKGIPGQASLNFFFFLRLRRQIQKGADFMGIFQRDRL